MLTLAGLLGLGLVAWTTAHAAHRQEAQLLARLKERLPRTAISHVDCARYQGAFCEIMAGRSLFYTDPTGRFLVVGRVYDVETREDVTAARLLELAPDTLIASAARRDTEAADQPVSANDNAKAGHALRTGPSANAQGAMALTQLAPEGRIVWGPAAGDRVVVFSDLHCPYCKVLHGALTHLGVHVEERLVSVLGTRASSDAVYCAHDPVKALMQAYTGQIPAMADPCDTRGLDLNERAFRSAGLGGVPVVVRADGAVLEGYRPAAELKAWLAQSRSTHVAGR